MMFSIVRSFQKKRAAARNYRILSAMDDDMLRDVGLDRRTLQTFCKNGCSHEAPQVSWSDSSLTGLRPRPLKTSLG